MRLEQCFLFRLLIDVFHLGGGGRISDTRALYWITTEPTNVFKSLGENFMLVSTNFSFSGGLGGG